MDTDYAELRRKAEANSSKMLAFLMRQRPPRPIEPVPGGTMVPAGLEYVGTYCSTGITCFSNAMVEFWGYSTDPVKQEYEPSGELVHPLPGDQFNKTDHREFTSRLKSVCTSTIQFDANTPISAAKQAVRKSNALARRIRQYLHNEELVSVLIDAAYHRPACVKVAGQQKAVIMHALSPNRLALRFLEVRTCMCGCGSTYYYGSTHDCPWPDDEEMPDEVLKKFADGVKQDLSTPLSQGNIHATIVLVI